MSSSQAAGDFDFSKKRGTSEKTFEHYGDRNETKVADPTPRVTATHFEL